MRTYFKDDVEVIKKKQNACQNTDSNVNKKPESWFKETAEVI